MIRLIAPVALAAALVVLAAAAPAQAGITGAAFAHGAPRAQADPDTSLDDFLDELADSTDLYFGLSASERDTAGLDSALAYALDHPEDQPEGPGLLRLGALPSFSFNRVDGPVWGGAVSVGNVRRIGQLGGELGYAAGPNEWLGGGSFRTAVRRGEAWWTGEVWGGRATHSIDPDRGEGTALSVLRALLIGSDRTHYLRRDGWSVRFGRETIGSRLAIGFRDMLERPLATTTTWNLLDREPSPIFNLPAERGRVRELSVEAGVRLPFAPVIVEIAHDDSRVIGDLFDLWFSEVPYRRTRAAASAEFGLGALATLVPQVAYGHLRGGIVRDLPAQLPSRLAPQAAFYLGGSHSLRSIATMSRGGTGLALARLDLLGASDILELMRLPHPDAFPIQAGLFVATGAVWGRDPYGGPSRPFDSQYWPRSIDWVHEAGASLMYQPGFPDPTTLIRLNYAWPLGPGRESKGWSITISRALDLVKPMGDE